MGVLTDDGAMNFLGRIQGVIAASDIILRLSSTNVAPADTLTAASFTEVAGGGYSAITLSMASATRSVVGNIAQLSWGQQVFSMSGALTGDATIYTVFATDAVTGACLWSDTVTPNLQPNASGGTVTISSVTIQMSKGTPT